jgi:hypothetical protein
MLVLFKIIINNNKQMKSIKIISILSLLLFLTIGLKANNENGNKDKSTNNYSNSLKKEIQSLISFPEFARQNKTEGFVLVQFEYDSNGRLKVLNANSNDDLLKSYVIQKLETFQMCKHALGSSMNNTMRFDFRIL